MAACVFIFVSLICVLVYVRGTYYNFNPVNGINRNIPRTGGIGGFSDGGFGPGSEADQYCAYCRQRGFHTCIKQWCNVGARAAATAFDNSDIGGIGGFSDGGFAPGSEADQYCAYCRQRGFHTCIKQWCNVARAAAAVFDNSDIGNRRVMFGNAYAIRRPCPTC